MHNEAIFFSSELNDVLLHCDVTFLYPISYLRLHALLGAF